MTRREDREQSWCFHITVTKHRASCLQRGRCARVLLEYNQVQASEQQNLQVFILRTRLEENDRWHVGAMLRRLRDSLSELPWLLTILEESKSVEITSFTRPHMEKMREQANKRTLLTSGPSCNLTDERTNHDQSSSYLSSKTATFSSATELGKICRAAVGRATEINVRHDRSCENRAYWFAVVLTICL